MLIGHLALTVAALFTGAALRLHAVRTALGALAAISFLFAVSAN